MPSRPPSGITLSVGFVVLSLWLLSKRVLVRVFFAADCRDLFVEFFAAGLTAGFAAVFVGDFAGAFAEVLATTLLLFLGEEAAFVFLFLPLAGLLSSLFTAREGAFFLLAPLLEVLVFWVLFFSSVIYFQTILVLSRELQVLQTIRLECVQALHVVLEWEEQAVVSPSLPKNPPRQAHA